MFGVFNFLSEVEGKVFGKTDKVMKSLEFWEKLRKFERVIMEKENSKNNLYTLDLY